MKLVRAARSLTLILGILDRDSSTSQITIIKSRLPLSLSCMLKTGQTYFKNLAVFKSQDF